MSKPPLKSLSSELFARKGSAKPAGHLIAYDRRPATGDRPDSVGKNGDATAAGNGGAQVGSGSDSDREASATAGSLFSIEFRKQVAESESQAPQHTADPAPDAAQYEPSDRAPGAGGRSEKPEAEARSVPGGSRSTDQAAAAAEPAKPAPALPYGPQDEGPRFGLLLALVAVLCLVVGILFTLDRRGEDDTQAVTPATPAGDGDAAAPGEDSATGADAGTSGTTTPESGESPSATAADSARGSEEPEASVEPRFDVIRLEPNGEAVIAGRATPNAELILLDNGEPIGTVTANWAGEWVFVPETPLAPGDHQFSLVVNTPQGTVELPAPGKDSGSAQPQEQGQDRPDTSGSQSTAEAKAAQPGAAIGKRSVPSDPKPPFPAHKPAPAELALSAGGDKSQYMIQLSSTNSLSGAQKEWVKLQRVFPQLLDGMELDVQKAKVDPLGTRYRVRTGGFADQNRARALCKEFRSLDQECLVIKR